MAKFEDPLQQDLDFTPDEVGEDENPAQEQEVEAQAPEEQEVATEEKPESSLPDKYKGKSIEELARMHQEAEKLIGRQAQEVGEHRKFFDEMMKRELLKSKAERQPNQEEVEDPDDKFFRSPTKSMDEYISNHPTIKQAQEQALLLKAQTIQQQLQQQHPDYVQVVQNPEFQQWVSSSPVRQRLYKEADDGYDIDAASELISTWKSLSGTKQSAQPSITPDSQQARTKSLKAAAVDTGASSVGSKKRYSRQALQDLLRTNPEKYYANADEILLAYDEGRVY
jgi:hypothetical protein